MIGMIASQIDWKIVKIRLDQDDHFNGSLQLLNGDPLHGFKDIVKRCLKCIDFGGDYFEGLWVKM